MELRDGGLGQGAVLLLIPGAALLGQGDILPVQVQDLLVVGMGHQIQPQLVNGKIQGHQLRQGVVGRREPAAQLLMKRQVQPGKKCSLLQGLPLVIPGRVLLLHGHKGKGQRPAAAGETALVLRAPIGRGAAACFCVQGDSSFTNRGYGPRAGAHSSICAPPPAGNGGFPFIGKCGMV